MIVMDNLLKDLVMHYFKKVFLVSTYMFSGLMIVGCGEANYSLSDVSPAQQGKFLDSAVEGLDYKSSSGEAGHTIAGGYFNYKIQDSVEFSVGKLSLGTASGDSIVTPRELAPAGSLIESNEIKNRVRLLLALDSDSYRVGIQIDKDTRFNAGFWADDINFSLGEKAFERAVDRVTTGDIRTLPSSAEAYAHFSKSLRCAYSGAYQGAWDVPDSNDSSGNVGVMLQANGNVVVMGDGQNINGQENSYMYIEGKHDINDKSYTFKGDSFFYYDKKEGKVITVNEGVAITGKGVSISYDTISGTFVNQGQRGSYTVSRPETNQNIAYRFTGFGYDDQGAKIGMIFMDIDDNGQISGLIHDMRHPSVQPTLSGVANFETGGVNILVDMPGFSSTVIGNIYFGDTSEILAPLKWIDQEGNTLGTVEIDGCQLSAIK